MRGRSRLAPVLLAAGLTLSCSTLAVPQERRPELSTPRHLQIAEELLRELSPEQTSYRHKNNVVHRKTATAQAECHADCSGFVNWLLLESHGRSPEALETWFQSKRPVARHYHDAIIAEKHFRRVCRIQDAEPGDIVAMRYPKGNENTGHVMLLTERPRKRTPTEPIVAETEQWEARIIDSTRSPHSNDARPIKKEASRGGLGAGVFRFYARSTGELIGYTWGLSPKSEYRPSSERPIVIGRFTPKNIEKAARSVKKATPH